MAPCFLEFGLRSNSFRLDRFIGKGWCLIGMFHNAAELHSQMNNQCVTQESVGHLNCVLLTKPMLLSSRTI